MLHIMTAYLLLPIGLFVALHDANRAGLIASPARFVGSHFASVLEFFENDGRYLSVLVWAALTTFGFDGGLPAALLLFVRALTLVPLINEQIEKVVEMVEEKRKAQ